MTNRWRLIRSGACSAAWNMAVDEALYKLSERGTIPPTLRLFRWTPAAVSIGRFQPIDLPEIQEHLHKGFCLIRRPTGGLAVLHENDLSYSIVGPLGESGIPTSTRARYRQAHEALMTALNSLGVHLDLYTGAEQRATTGLCSASPMQSDLILHDGKKIGGSAQFKGERAVLQHGCVHTPTPLCHTRFEDEVSAAFERTMQLSFGLGELTPCEQSLAQDLVARKYSRDEWNLAGHDPT